MNDQQRDSAAKFLYDMAKGIGLITVVGGLASGQVTGTSVIVGLVAMIEMFLFAQWLEGETRK